MTRLFLLLLTLFSLSGLANGANSEFRHSSLAAKTTASGAENVAQLERLKASYLAQEIQAAPRAGTALSKADPYHRAASFVTQEQMAAGKAFTIRGGDGVQRVRRLVEGLIPKRRRTLSMPLAVG
jgi:hypothetical protein